MPSMPISRRMALASAIQLLVAVSDPGISGEACRPNTITSLACFIPAGLDRRWEIEVRQLVCSRQEDYRMQLEIMVFIRT